MKSELLFEFRFVNTDNWEELLKEIINFNYSKSNILPFIITPNVDQIVKYEKNRHLKDTMKKSFLILPDGQPIIWASYLLNKPLKKRLTGADLFPILWKELIKKNENIFFILPNNEVGNILKKEYPKIVYRIAPFINLSDTKSIESLASEYSDIITRNNINYVFIGLGFPKQEILAIEILNRLRTYNNKKIPIFLLLGAAFEFYVGLKKRSPKIFQDLGLEWFYRFLTEPKRLFKRYFIEDIAFFKLLINEYLKNRRSI